MALPSDAEERESAGDFEGAALAYETRGDLARASELWEKACDYGAAARAALKAQLHARALILAGRVQDASIVEEIVIGATASPAAARDGALDAASLGFHRIAANVYLRLEDPAAAAPQFELAGDLLAAGRAFRAADEPRDASRCFERLLRTDPAHDEVRIELATLLLDHGRAEPALRHLQKITPDNPLRGRALPPLLSALRALDLDQAALAIDAEMSRLGVEPTATATATATDAAQSDVERVLFGRFVIAAEIAKTPTARVYRARDRITGNDVAVKVFAASSLQEAGRDALVRFEREARALGQLRHPAIVPLLHYLPSGPAVVLPWMVGGCLGRLLEREALSPARAVEIVRRVLSALGEAHRRGMLHRDIKPANVLLDEAGGAYLADFGTAHVSDAARTVTAGIVGTLAYMAPEQRAGAKATLKSDIYGAGAILWHALTGAPVGVRTSFLSDELTPAHIGIAQRLVGPEDERPVDTVAAIELLESISWPRAVPAALPKHVSQPPVEQPVLERLERGPGDAFTDTLLKREVRVLPSTEPLVRRARAFAAAGHVGLATPLKLDRATSTLWVEHFPAWTGPLDETAALWLRDALAALHATGTAHGAICVANVRASNGRPVLAFSEAQDGSMEDDRAALSGLTRTISGDTIRGSE